MPPAKTESIRLRGVRQNNLKNFDLELPVGRLTVVTGLSGTGKSSLVFETLHAEGQRRYVETFSPYTRQFLELLDRPDVDTVENIRPSIAIRQSNTVKTSRSTVGTITELCDYFKVWFSRNATLHDPATGRPIRDDHPRQIWKKLLRNHRGEALVLAFPLQKPDTMDYSEFLRPLLAQGFTRAILGEKLHRLENLSADDFASGDQPAIVQDRVRIEPANRSRFIEAAEHALSFGHGALRVHDSGGALRHIFSRGLTSPETGETFRPASPALFSFNSPIGACPNCRGFGRIIEIDDDLILPDHGLSIDEGAIRPFRGEIYSESLRDLRRAARKKGVRTNVPWRDLTGAEKTFVLEGDPRHEENPATWYGVRRFFDYLESKLYKMHVRVFLSKFRSYNPCPDCGGARLRPEALNWKWRGHTLPDLYQKTVGELLDLFGEPAPPRSPHTSKPAFADKRPTDEDSALKGILSRLGFLDQVGLHYLNLDRPSRTLSGGETMRVNLTSCLGSSLVDTLFVLDEPSVGLHARDIDRLTAILRRLTDQGNTVIVVEHDESVIRAADHLVEIGPRPGENGGHLTFSGDLPALLDSATRTGAFLSGRETIEPPTRRRATDDAPRLSVYGATCHNLRGFDLHIPQQKFVCLSGVSGSGKSTLLDPVIYRNLAARKGNRTDSPGAVRDIESELPLSEIVLVDQSPVSKTPRSNPALFSGAWEEIRKLFARLDDARSAGLTPGHFSFNSGEGRCPACSGLGYERVEMQFVSDLFVPCEICEGRRFKPEILEIRFQDRTIMDILEFDVARALGFFSGYPKITAHLQPLADVGLGYLKLGQPLNTLSGGESQRLKLVRYLGRVSRSAAPDAANASHHALLLIDEPTTGLHRADIKTLIRVFQTLVDAGHSLIMIEHNTDVLKVADWIVELGPEAGEAGGRIVAEGPPETIARSEAASAPYLRAVLKEDSKEAPESALPQAAEAPAAYPAATSNPDIGVRGAREHNLRNISATVPRNAITVVTGVSGSGKSSLAFDIIFAEGQRRFMESMSAYARQFVEQMPKAEVDVLDGISPTVAIEQRVTKGTRKSTVATITEVAQFLRLLYARIGIQHSPTTGSPVVTQTPEALLKRLRQLLREETTPRLRLCAQLVRGRKGHHQPLADWARDHGHELLRVDGRLVPVDKFQKLDRYREHDIDLVVADLRPGTPPNPGTLRARLDEALRLGKGTAFLLGPDGRIHSWLSTRRTDPTTGEAFPELNPKHFSWNSPRGWCPTCRGYGYLHEDLEDDDAVGLPADTDPGTAPLCPDCRGTRLNPLSRAVKLPLKKNGARSLPDLLHLSPSELLRTLRQVRTNLRTRPVLEELLPEIEERLRFMDRVGLGYLTLDRATATLSGGEAQRIRLAAQLGSNLSGVLYILDEPSIGLHARDNEKLLQSLRQLRDRGNTLLVVEHDETTMARADKIIDLGPGAGIHGGEIVATGTLDDLRANEASVTGHCLRHPMPHPLRGSYRELPVPWTPRRKKDADQWIALRGAALRNLKGFDLALPKQRLTLVCGVSGAGKSTLVRDLLKPLVENAIASKSPKLLPKQNDAAVRNPGDGTGSGGIGPVFKSLQHAGDIRKVIEVDQAPIGKTPRSTPATYIGAFDIIREIYASLPEARFRGYGSGTFSFNTKTGRCESCRGAGRIKLEMNFMPDTYVTCEDCGGSRYGPELADLRWNGKNIAETLAMSFEEAAGFFHFHARLKALLDLMVETGLGYLTLGQSSPTLSGGEAQRLKLVSELAKGLPSLRERSHGRGQGNLYILEEPTIGLHTNDCRRLIEVLHRLVDHGHTVIVIEHHLDLLTEADYLVEIGPEGGANGGQLLYQGPAQDIRPIRSSPTARFLRTHLPKKRGKAKGRHSSP